MTGKVLAIHCNHPGIAILGQRIPDSRNMGNMMARATWITWSLSIMRKCRGIILEEGYLALQYSAMATPQTMPHKHWRSNKKNIAIKTLKRAKLILWKG